MVALVVGPNVVELEMNCPLSLQKMKRQPWKPNLELRQFPARWTR